MKFDFTINWGNVLTVLMPALLAIWGAVHSLTNTIKSHGEALDAHGKTLERIETTAEKQGESLGRVEAEVASLKTAAATSATEQRQFRADLEVQAHRLTRIDTLLEVALPGLIADPEVRAVFRDAGRRAATRREAGEPQ